MVDVFVHEVGTRDGLQSVPFFVPTAVKQAWCSAEFAAGIREIEVCSFVPVKLLPQFADAADVVEHALALDGLTVAALVPNLKGAQRAMELGVHKINFVLSVSESHNLSNVRRSTAESLADLKRIAEFLRGIEPARRPKLFCGLATSFGCTIEGNVPHDRVVRFAEAVAAIGVDEIGLADTVGFGNPNAIRTLFTRVRKAVGQIPLLAHFHDTRGLGIANVAAAIEAGVRAFDASLCGLGGCPYAPGATGNVVTEDVVFLAESLGFDTGIDLEKLIEVRRIVAAALPGEVLYGQTAKAGLPKGFAYAQARKAA